MAHILLGVTGSIAAFKACHLASDWSKQGHEVRVVMTAGVCHSADVQLAYAHANTHIHVRRTTQRL